MIVLVFILVAIISGFIVNRIKGWRFWSGMLYFFVSDFFLCLFMRMVTHRSTVAYVSELLLTEMRTSHVIKYLLICGFLLVLVLICGDKLVSSGIEAGEGKTSYKCLVRSLFPISIVVFIVMLFFSLHGWAVSSFQMERPDAVIATLSVSHSHIDNRIYTSLIFEVIGFSILATGVICVLSLPFVRYFKIRFVRPVASALLIVGCLVYVFSDIPIMEYVDILMNGGYKPERSEFYDKYYVDPSNVKLTFPKKKRNLIVVFLESYESTLSDKPNGGLCEKNFMPELTKLCKDELSFGTDKAVGGGYTIEGTGWTIAGILAKLNGIVYSPVIYNQEESHVIDQFLPYNTGLTDILKNEGYNMVFACGSDGDFANRDKFFRSHGGVIVHDINYYKKEGMLAEYYNVNWGFEDQKLYQFAKNDITELSKKDEPFFYSMLTVDTHPNGYICDLCDKNYQPGEEYQTAFACGDRQVCDFIRWAKEQEWYENTTIVIMGDHTMPLGSASRIYDREYRDDHRKWLDVFVNAKTVNGINRDRNFSSLDMFPTILESMGVDVDGHRLGFGSSLFSDTSTLLEKIDISSVEEELNTICTQYIYWETGENIK